MTLLDALLSPDVLLALITLIIMSIAGELVAIRLLNAVSDVPASEWIFEHFVLPAGRAFMLVVFILIAYPALFGLPNAPDIDLLLQGGPHRMTTLMNVIVILPVLLLPLIPVIGGMHAMVLPLQGIAASALLFHWLAQSYHKPELGYWPGFPIVGLVIVLAILSHATARWIAGLIAEQIERDLNVSQANEVVYNIVVSAFQIPVILVYTLALGRKLLN
jgi:uncharacterized membrane protein